MSFYTNLAQTWKTGDMLFIYITRPVSLGKVSVHQPWRLMATEVITSGQNGAASLIFTTTNPWNMGPVGASVFVRYYYVRGANLSSTAYLTTVTV